MKRAVIAGVGGLLVAGAAGLLHVHAQPPSPSRELRELTGARTRIVWCAQVEGDGSDSAAAGNQLRLMGLDTDDGRGARPILDAVGNYRKPLISPRGDRVVYTDFPRARICAVNWDGAGARTLADGFALDVWRDPASGREWVYALDARTLDADNHGKSVVRFLLDQPETREKVWDATLTDLDNFQVSADGARAAALFPWPAAGIADLRAGTWQELGRGCWPGLAPDNSGRMWIFDGAHRNLLVHSTADGRSWKVRINGAPGLENTEVYHPRWSNHPRFLALTGPYKVGSGENRIRAGGPEVEVYAGRFDPGLERIEKWVRVTQNQCADFFPDLWIEPSAPGAAPSPATPAARAEAGTPSAASRRLIVEARLAEITPTPSLRSIAPYTNALVVYSYTPERVVAGEYREPSVLVAHWGLRNSRPVPIPRKKGDLYRLVLEPMDSRKELEGERLVMDVSDIDRIIYYEVPPEK